MSSLTSIPGLVSTSPSLRDTDTTSDTSDSGDSRLAPPGTTNPTEQPLSASQVQHSGIAVGRRRMTDEDVANLVAKEAIKNEFNEIKRVASQESSQANLESTVSSSQLVTQIESRTYTSSSRTNDVIRSLQKLQRTCNHKYDASSKRCIFCNKHRDSHVYDVGSKLSLNQ